MRSSYQASISADGRYVAFVSNTDNLAGYDENGVSDIFVYDRQADEMERVSIASDGSEANAASLNPSLSANGRYVTFQSTATGNTRIFISILDFRSVPICNDQIIQIDDRI